MTYRNRPAGAVHFDAALRSRRLFDHLMDLLNREAALRRAAGRSIRVTSNRTVGSEFRRTRVEITEGDEVLRRCRYRCDGGFRGWGDPDRCHLRDTDTGQRYYALTMNGGPQAWSPHSDGSKPHISNRDMVGLWLASTGPAS